DGQYVAVAWLFGKDGGRGVTVFDVKGTVIHTLPAHGEELLAFTPDGKTLIAVHRGNRTVFLVTRWKVADGKKIGWLELPGPADIVQSAVSADGNKVARRWQDSPQIDLFDLDVGKPLYEKSGDDGAITALAFSPDGKYLASSDRYEAKLWDLSKGSEIQSWPVLTFHRIVFSADGKLIAGAGVPSLSPPGLETVSIWVYRVPKAELLKVLEVRT